MIWPVIWKNGRICIMHKNLFFILLTFWFSFTAFASPPSSPVTREFSFSDSIMWKSIKRLQPHPENPYYFSYNGKPVWLNGHSRLWTLNGWMPESHEPLKDRSENKSRHQSTDMRTYVDEIRDMSQAGVHFIRITPFWPDGWKRGLPMPWLYRKGKKFDLLQWDKDYWKYYRDFMARCAEKNIIVQVEIWDRPGLSHNHESRWKSHPFHPDHNINYGHDVLPGSSAQAQNIVTRKRLFYASVKGKNKKLLKFQEAYVKKLLQETAPFPNIIYCIDNEGTGSIEWESYWAGFIRKKIPDALITAMPLDRVDNTWKSYFEHSDFNCMDGGGSGLRFALEGFSGGGQQGRPDTWASRLDQLYLVRETMAKYRQYMEHYPEKKRPVYVSNSFNASMDNIWIMFCSGAAGLRYHRILYDEQERMWGCLVRGRGKGLGFI